MLDFLRKFSIECPCSPDTLTVCVCSTGSLPGQCNFEDGVCGYFQDKKGDKADWLRVRGHTPTSYTGPRGDHTTGVGESFPHSLLYSFIQRSYPHMMDV